MPFAQGEALVLPFPYSDRLAEKRRPAVVISRPSFEQNHGLVWVAMVTSDRGKPLAYDVSITQLERVGLPAPSLIRPTKLATIEPGRVIRVAGTLTKADLQSLLSAIRSYL